MQYRKYLILIAALAGFGSSALADSTRSEALFEKYTDTEGYTTINVGPGLFEFATIFGDELKPLKQVQGVRILRAKNPAAGKALLDEYPRLLGDNNYVEMVDITETGKKTTVYGMKDGEIITEVLVLENSDHATVISIRGTLDKATIAKVRNTIHTTHCKDHADHHGA